MTYRVRVLHSDLPTMRYDDRDTALLVVRALRYACRASGRHNPVVMDVTP